MVNNKTAKKCLFIQAKTNKLYNTINFLQQIKN